MGNIQRIKELADKMRDKHQFKAGDVVRWKDGLKNRRFPEYGEEVVVFEALGAPVCGLEDPGSNTFNEPLDITICRLDSDNDFVVYHYDSRRFELAG